MRGDGQQMIDRALALASPRLRPQRKRDDAFAVAFVNSKMPLLERQATPRSDKQYWSLLKAELSLQKRDTPERSLNESFHDEESFATPTPLSPDDDAPVAAADSEPSRGWLSLLSHYVHGADITTMKVPIALSAPVSNLELADAFMRSGGALRHVHETFCDPSTGRCAYARMESVLHWYLSNLRVNEEYPMEGYMGKRPHMPIIGERTCQFYDTGGGGVAYTVAEQLSYDPKVTGLFMEAPNLGVTYVSVTRPLVTLRGNSVQMGAHGSRHVTVRLPDSGRTETYVVESAPQLVVRNIFLGALFLEFEGRLSVRCRETGVRAEVDFHPAGFMGLAGTPRFQVTGHIRGGGDDLPAKRIAGLWADKVYSWSCVMETMGAPGGFAPPSERDLPVLFDHAQCHESSAIERIPCHPKVRFKLDVDGLVSENIWSKVNSCLKSGELEAAAHYKAKLTHTQRKYHQMRVNTLKPHVPLFFQKREERFPSSLSIEKIDAGCAGSETAAGGEDLGYWVPKRDVIASFVQPFPKLAMQRKREPDNQLMTQLDPPSPIAYSPVDQGETWTIPL